MKASILVPLYGVERYVEQCARSLFEQRFESVEFIFVDDCSPDNSASIVEQLLKEYPDRRSRTTIVRNDVNMGVSATRNRALECAQGDFVIFVDGDDWCDPEMVEQMVIEQINTNSDVVTSSYYAANDADCRVVDASPIGGVDGSLRIVVSQSFDLPNRIWGILMRRNTLIKNNLRFDSSISMGEDYLFLVQLLYYSTKISHLDTPLYYYRVGVGTMANIGQNDCRSYIRAVANVRQFLSSRDDYSDFTGALRLSRFNLRRWLLLRQSRGRDLRSLLYRSWCYILNFGYHIYCWLRHRRY